MLITWPPKASTNGLYSASGSQIRISSWLLKNVSVISLLALNDFPEPGTPKISPFGFCNAFLLASIILLLMALSP